MIVNHHVHGRIWTCRKKMGPGHKIYQICIKNRELYSSLYPIVPVPLNFLLSLPCSLRINTIWDHLSSFSDHLPTLFLLFFSCLSFFWHLGLLNRLVDQAGLRLIEIHLPLLQIPGLKATINMSSFDYSFILILFSISIISCFFPLDILSDFYHLSTSSWLLCYNSMFTLHLSLVSIQY